MILLFPIAARGRFWLYFASTKAKLWTRDHLSKLLWPGRFEAHSKASLRQCVLDLGKLLAPFGHDMLDVTRTCIALSPGSIQTDLDELEHALARSDCAAATVQLVDIGTKPLLDQMDFGDAFNQWLAKQRNSVAKRLSAAVAAHAQLRDVWSARDLGAVLPAVPSGKIRIAPLAHGTTHNKEAYDLYLQARALNVRFFGDGVLACAVGLLEQAVAIDPQFAEAWLLLGDVHQRIGIVTACADLTAATHMADCVRKAIQLKPDLGQAYSLLSLHQLTQNNFVGALDLAFKGYQLEPQNPAVALRLGTFLLFCGRTRDGMKYINEAIDQDPVDGRHYMCRSAGQLNLGDVAAAIADGQRALDTRISRAARSVCGDNNGVMSLRETSLIKTCIANARNQAAAAVKVHGSIELVSR
jgi:UrcA family protein